MAKKPPTQKNVAVLKHEDSKRKNTAASVVAGAFATWVLLACGAEPPSQPLAENLSRVGPSDQPQDLRKIL